MSRLSAPNHLPHGLPNWAKLYAESSSQGLTRGGGLCDVLASPQGRTIRARCWMNQLVSCFGHLCVSRASCWCVITRSLRHSATACSFICPSPCSFGYSPQVRSGNRPHARRLAACFTYMSGYWPHVLHTCPAIGRMFYMLARLALCHIMLHFRHSVRSQVCPL